TATLAPLCTESAFTMSPRSASTKSTATRPVPAAVAAGGENAARCDRGAAHMGPADPSSTASPANVARAVRPDRFHNWRIILLPPSIHGKRTRTPWVLGVGSQVLRVGSECPTPNTQHPISHGPR